MIISNLISKTQYISMTTAVQSKYEKNFFDYSWLRDGLLKMIDRKNVGQARYL